MEANQAGVPGAWPEIRACDPLPINMGSCSKPPVPMGMTPPCFFSWCMAGPTAPHTERVFRSVYQDPTPTIRGVNSRTQWQCPAPRVPAMLLFQPLAKMPH